MKEGSLMTDLHEQLNGFQSRTSLRRAAIVDVVVDYIALWIARPPEGLHFVQL